jgi:hypothetical protein
MDSGFFERRWIGTSGISSAIEFMHRTKDYFHIPAFDERKKFLVLFVKEPIGYLLRSVRIW